MKHPLLTFVQLVVVRSWLLVFLLVSHQSSAIGLPLDKSVVASSRIIPPCLDLLSLSDLYRLGRDVRIERGHTAAQPYYAEIVRRNPRDGTTATHLAASSSTLYQQWQTACRPRPTTTNFGKSECADRQALKHTEAMSQLRQWFTIHNFTSRAVGEHMGLNQQQQQQQRQLDPNYTAAADATAWKTGGPADAAAPVYVRSAAAGTAGPWVLPTDDDGTASSSSASILHCLIAWFLLGVAVPYSTAVQCCSQSIVRLLMDDLGILCQTDGCDNGSKEDPFLLPLDPLLVAVVSVMPVDIPTTTVSTTFTTMYAVTDWHPRVLNTIRIYNENDVALQEETVMYVGPDSLALLEHWLHHPWRKEMNQQEPMPAAWLDVCSGSGIQALAGLVSGKATVETAVCIDMNPRALRFAAFSATLNGIPVLSKDTTHSPSAPSMVLIHGDVVRGTGRLYDPSHRFDNPPIPHCDGGLAKLIHDLSQIRPSLKKFGTITSNPPFIPVPGTGMPLRYGLFSAGGHSGEIVLAAVLSLSEALLCDGGMAAIVSEFFFNDLQCGPGSAASRTLLVRLKAYWSNAATVHLTDTVDGADNCSIAKVAINGLLFTNAIPISAKVYADRRSDTPDEALVWNRHLYAQGIAACSPGLLFVRKPSMCLSMKNETSKESPNQPDIGMDWEHYEVPKSSLGSIWTPGNVHSVRFIESQCSEYISGSVTTKATTV